MMSRNRSRPSAILSSPVTLILALVILVFLARAATKIYSKTADSSVRLDEARANLAKMEAKRIDLKDQIQNLSTPEGIVASIREKYRAVEPGESVAVIINRDAATGTPGGGLGVEASDASTREMGWWQRILRMIGL